jgi:hypothetical protein
MTAAASTGATGRLRDLTVVTQPTCFVQFPTLRPLPVAVRGRASANEALKCFTDSPRTLEMEAAARIGQGDLAAGDGR